MKHFKMLAVLLAVLIFATSSFAADGGGKHKAAKQTAVKENKKFTPVSFTYNNTSGLGVTDPNNYTAADPTSVCTDNVNFCGISFDADTYPLDHNGKPTSTFLTNQVAVHEGDALTAPFTVNGVTYYRKS